MKLADKNLGKEEQLIYGIEIPENFENIKELNKQRRDSIISELDTVQIELSKLLEPILNIDNPIFEDLISFIIKRIKFLKTRVSSLPLNPTAVHTIKKVGEKQKKIIKKEAKHIFLEIFFFNSIILNQCKRIF